MITRNKKIHLKIRKVSSAYAIANSDRLAEAQIVRTIGSSRSGVSRMISNSEEQAAIMKDIINISPTSSSWNEELAKYWNKLSYDIPDSGKELEIGFTYDVHAIDKQHYINKINSNITVEAKKLKTDEDLEKYIEERIESINMNFLQSIERANSIKDARLRDKMTSEAYKIKYDQIVTIEGERFKVGSPINPFEYMLYRWCLVYGDVANEKSLINKSSKIRFYLHSQDEIVKETKTKQTNEKNRLKLLVKVTESLDSITNLIYAMGEANGVSDMTDEIGLYDYVTMLSVSRESDFIRIASDTNLSLIGKIEKYIASGILTRKLGTNIISNPINPDEPIGSTMEEVIDYFKKPSNKVVIQEFEDKFKTINETK